MADMHDQAQAIWKALDKMMETDPDKYKKFIEEQMESSKQFFMEAQKSGGGNNILGEMVKFAPNTMGDMSKGDGKNSLGLGKTSNNGPAKKPAKSKPQSKVTPVPIPKSATDLTDDAFNMTSLLSSICPEEDEDSSDILGELRLPGAEEKGKGKKKEKLSGTGAGDQTAKKKPLIEEL